LAFAKAIAVFGNIIIFTDPRLLSEIYKWLEIPLERVCLSNEICNLVLAQIWKKLG